MISADKETRNSWREEKGREEMSRRDGEREVESEEWETSWRRGRRYLRSIGVLWFQSWQKRLERVSVEREGGRERIRSRMEIGGWNETHWQRESEANNSFSLRFWANCSDSSLRNRSLSGVDNPICNAREAISFHRFSPMRKRCSLSNPCFSAIWIKSIKSDCFEIRDEKDWSGRRTRWMSSQRSSRIDFNWWKHFIRVTDASDPASKSLWRRNSYRISRVDRRIPSCSFVKWKTLNSSSPFWINRSFDDRRIDTRRAIISFISIPTFGCLESSRHSEFKHFCRFNKEFRSLNANRTMIVMIEL